MQDFFRTRIFFRYIIASMAGYPSTAKPSKTWSLAHGSNATQDFLGFYQAGSSLIQSIFQMLYTGRFILQLHVFELALMLQDQINFATELCLQSLSRWATRLFQRLAALEFHCVSTSCFFDLQFKSYNGNFEKWIKRTKLHASFAFANHDSASSIFSLEPLGKGTPAEPQAEELAGNVNCGIPEPIFFASSNASCLGCCGFGISEDSSKALEPNCGCQLLKKSCTSSTSFSFVNCTGALCISKFSVVPVDLVTEISCHA